MDELYESFNKDKLNNENELENFKSIAINLKLFAYKNKNWVKVDRTNEILNTKSLKIITYNVWYDRYKFEKRVNEIFSIIKIVDIICLQEVTPRFLKLLKNTKWIRSFYVSDINGYTIEMYGNIIISRFPFDNLSIHTLPTCMGRSFIMGTFKTRDSYLKIGTVHLESGSNNDLYRKHQLRIINDTLSGDCAILTGDFNSDKKINFSKYIDIWPCLQKNNDGYTFYDNGTITKQAKIHRFDKIIITTPEIQFKTSYYYWLPQVIELIGNKMFKVEENIYPSDHFGLMTIIQLIKVENKIDF